MQWEFKILVFDDLDEAEKELNNGDEKDGRWLPPVSAAICFSMATLSHCSGRWIRIGTRCRVNLEDIESCDKK